MARILESTAQHIQILSYDIDKDSLYWREYKFKPNGLLNAYRIKEDVEIEHVVETLEMVKKKRMQTIILEIHGGEGGDDSKLFVPDLASAYVKYAKRMNLKVKILDVSNSDYVLKICGKEAEKYFKNESGKHTIQRVPPTETKGRKQTSVVSVAILSLPPNNQRNLLKDSEIEVSTQRGHGKGGQHQNKTDSAVRMKHKETGLSVFINGRDQHKNKKEALEILSAKVNEKRLESEQGSYNEKRKGQLGGGGRSDKRRTYNFMDDRCVDHVLGTKCKNAKRIIEKGLFELINKV